MNEFDKTNKSPNYIERIKMPSEPSVPSKPNITGFYNDHISRNYFKYSDTIHEKYRNVKNKFKKLESWEYFDGIPPVSVLKEKKMEYEKNCEKNCGKNYNDKFNKHYKEYRMNYYQTLIGKYMDKYAYIDNINENQYRITIHIYEYSKIICCELKPTLSDDYPCVLRKMKTQIELTNNDKTTLPYSKTYTLIIRSFVSSNCSKEQLVTIFKQSNIKIIFADEILGLTKKDTTLEELPINHLLEENKIITANLLQFQQKLLYAEDTIKKLEEEIVLLKSKKKTKTITDYFVK